MFYEFEKKNYCGLESEIVLAHGARVMINNRERFDKWRF